MNINIEQTTGTQEIINSAIIDKLYLLATDPNNTVTLSGNLYSAKGYKIKMDYLNTIYSPNFIINIPQSEQYISFTDPEFLRLCVTNISSDGEGVSQVDIDSVTKIENGASSPLGLACHNNKNLVSLIDLLKFQNLSMFSADSFMGCDNVTEVGVPKSVNYIGRQFLYNNSKCDKIVVEDIDSFCLIYLNLTGLFLFTNNSKLYTIQGGLETEVKNLTISRDIDSRTEYLFANCKSILSVTYLNGVTTIGGKNVFNGCTNLTQLTIPHSIVTIQYGAFKNCSLLTGDLVFPNLTSIGGLAFYGTGITSCDFRGSTFTSISASCFEGCNSLTTLRLPTTVTNLGEKWYPTAKYPTQIMITGLDNVTDHSTYNYALMNKYIINPICNKAINNMNLISSNGDAGLNAVSYTNSYFLPNLVKTRSANDLFYSTPYSTQYTYKSQSRSDRACRFGLLYFKNIEHFNAFTFFDVVVQDLVINNITPPDLVDESTNLSTYTYYQDWSTKIFPTGVPVAPQITTLWVPDSAVATYQANPLYSGLTIKGINTKTNGTDYDLPRFATFADWELAYDTAIANDNPVPIGLIEEYM